MMNTHWEKIGSWFIGLLLGMYVVAFMLSMVIVWFYPQHNAGISLLEKWLIALTPLVTLTIQHYLKRRQL